VVVVGGLEADSPSWRDAHFLAGAGVAADASLAGLDLKHAEAAEFDSFAALHREPHRFEYRIHGYLGLDLGDIRGARHLVHDVDLDHA
jgi:hypothetical protein